MEVLPTLLHRHLPRLVHLVFQRYAWVLLKSPPARQPGNLGHCGQRGQAVGPELATGLPGCTLPGLAFLKMSGGTVSFFLWHLLAQPFASRGGSAFSPSLAGASCWRATALCRTCGARPGRDAPDQREPARHHAGVLRRTRSRTTRARHADASRNTTKK